MNYYSFLSDNFLLTIENDGLKEEIHDELYDYAKKYSLRHYKHNQSYTDDDIDKCWNEFIHDLINSYERETIKHFFRMHRLQIYGEGEDNDGYKTFKYYRVYPCDDDDFKSIFSDVLNKPQTIKYKHLNEDIRKYIDKFNKVFSTPSDNIDFNVYTSKDDESSARSDDEHINGHITYSCFANEMTNFVDIEVADSKLIGKLKHRPFNEKERISEMENLADIDYYMPSSSTLSDDEQC